LPEEERKRNVHILVIEDEQRLALLLRRILVGERHTVEVAYDGQEGLDLALSNPYDLILLDLMLPGKDGLEICEILRRQAVSTPILMVTARGELEDKVAGLNTGADDYVTKPFAVKELIARVNALLRRRERPFAREETLSVGDLTLDLIAHEVRRGNELIELTAKEYSLLELFMRHPNQVFSRDQIMNSVWSYDSDALSNIVDSYVHFLREKIDRRFAPSLIKTVRGIGYKMTDGS
jgi:DNA-binding response OmpR family regulator